MGLSSYAAGLPCAGRQRGSTLAAPLAFAFGCGLLTRSHWLCCRALRLGRQHAHGRRSILRGDLIVISGCSRASPLCRAMFIRSSMALRMLFLTPALARLRISHYLIRRAIMLQARFRLSRFGVILWTLRLSPSSSLLPITRRRGSRRSHQISIFSIARRRSIYGRW